MTKNILQYTITIIMLVMAQALVFNNICLFNLAVPFVFIYFIALLPLTLPVNALLTIAFLAGLTVDIFANTQGVNALACTITAMSRRSILHIYFPREDELSIPEPSIRSLGLAPYAKYLLTLTTIYCTIAFTAESLSLFNLPRLCLRIATSTILTFLLLLGLDSVVSQHDKTKP